MPSGSDLGLPPFRQRFPWVGRHLQTTRNFLVHEQIDMEAERLELPLRDATGDRLVGALSRADADVGNRPLVVLLHGLSGSQESRYMLTGARYLLERGHDVIRLNQRGAGPSRGTCQRHYHAGSSDDLRDALLALPPHLVANGVVVIGFSLGGNVSLKFAAELEAELAATVRAVAAVSAPIDLAATSRNMLRWQNKVYTRHLLRDFQTEYLAESIAVSDDERHRIRRARNFLEFDQDVVAPRNGFADAWDYYARTMALPRLAEIDVPTLLVQARDDPIVPAAPYLDYPWHCNDKLFPLLPGGGGHVGFHSRAREPWYLLAIGSFLSCHGL